MKLLALITLLLALTGCTTVVPVTQKWPEPPGTESLQACAKLKKLENTAQLSDVAKTVAANYNEYHKCGIKVEAWQEWYQKQQQIHKGLK